MYGNITFCLESTPCFKIGNLWARFWLSINWVLRSNFTSFYKSTEAVTSNTKVKKYYSCLDRNKLLWWTVTSYTTALNWSELAITFENLMNFVCLSGFLSTSFATTYLATWRVCLKYRLCSILSIVSCYEKLSITSKRSYCKQRCSIRF